MLITKPLQADAFFMENVFSRQDREPVGELSRDLTNAYIVIFSKHLDLPFRDTHHLTNEMTFQAISAFIDTAYRLKQEGFSTQSVVESGFQELLSGFFSEETVRSSLGSSRILRCRLANLMLQSLGKQPLFEDINQEPRQIRLDDLELPLAKVDRYWRMHYNLSRRIPNALVQYSKAHWNRLRQWFRGDLVRIGHLIFDYKYMWQMPDIQWVPLDIDLGDFLVPVKVEKRRELYESLHDRFLAKAGALPGWERVTGLPAVPNEFLELLLALIVLKGESLLCHTKPLHQAINFCVQSLRAKNLQAIFSIGNWFRFHNAVIAVAGRRLGLPVIMFQSAADGIYINGKGFDWGDGEHDPNQYVDHQLVWGEWKHKEKQLIPKYHRVPNPAFAKSNDSFSWKNKVNRQLNVLCPLLAFSSLYSVENRLVIESYQISEHRHFVEKFLSVFEDSSNIKRYKLYIKVKGFGYTLFQDHPWMLVPFFKHKNLLYNYLLRGDASQYFPYMDLICYDIPGTVFSLGLNYNIPTIILWNPLFRPRNEFLELFEELEEVGIICRDSQLFAENLTTIIQKEYWFGPKVQRARKNFCEAYAVSSPNWKFDINKVLIKECLSIGNEANELL